MCKAEKWRLVVLIIAAGGAVSFTHRAAWGCPRAPVSVPRIVVGSQRVEVAYLGFDRNQGSRCVSFDGSYSYDPDGGCIREFGWSYQDNPFPDEAHHHQSCVSKTYYQPGCYEEIRLGVVDDEGQDATDVCDLYLVEATLNMDPGGGWMGDPAEYDDGAFIPLNDDDDNGNGVPDKDETGVVQYEDDMLMLFPYTEPAPFSLKEGTVTLEAVSGGSKIKLWTYSDKGLEVSLPKSWPITGLLGQTFYIEGVQASGSAKDVELKLTYSYQDESSVDRVRLTVLQVQSVVWLGVNPGDGKTNLSNDNPASHGGGCRLFAERNTFDGELHDKVEAQATINVEMPAGKTCKVYFRAFDMDDPTQNGPGNVVDINDTATEYNGGDNKPLEPQGPGIGVPPPLEEEATVSGSTNCTRLEYTVGKRNPGNNFKVVAHCIKHYRGHVVIDTGAGGRGLDFKLRTSGPTIPAKYRTLLLSVWRRLHVEVDSMGAPPPGTQWEQDDWPVPDVPDPDTGLLVPAFERAYVLPVFDTGKNNSNAQFLYALYPMHAAAMGEESRGTRTWESSEYWVAYVQGAYEGDQDDDNDPNDEPGPVLGYNAPDEPEYAFVYLEVLRDVCVEKGLPLAVYEGRVVAHEIAHQFELAGPHEGCIMDDIPDTTYFFCDSCLAAIRTRDFP